MTTLQKYDHIKPAFYKAGFIILTISHKRALKVI